MTPYRPPLTDEQRVVMLRAELAQTKAREQTMLETLTRCQRQCTKLREALLKLRVARREDSCPAE